MEKKINFVIRSGLGSGEILSKLGKNKAGEPSIIFYSQQRPSGWFDRLKLDVRKLFGSVRSGTEVAREYSKELSSAVPSNPKDKTTRLTPSFSTPQALEFYLNSIKDGSYTLSEAGRTTTVNIDIEDAAPLDDAFSKRSWNDNDRKILQSLQSPNNASKYSPYQSSRQLADGTSAPAPEITSATEKEKLPEI